MEGVIDYIYLISADELKEITQIMPTVSNKYIEPVIRKSQDIYLATILGEKLLSAIYDRIRDENLLGYYKELYELCRYYVQARTLSELAIVLSYKLSQMGLSKSNSDNAEVASFSEIISMKDYYRAESDFYCLKIQKFIKRHHSEFIELIMDDRYDIPEQLHSYSSCGLFLGNQKGR